MVFSGRYDSRYTPADDSCGERCEQDGYFTSGEGGRICKGQIVDENRHGEADSSQARHAENHGPCGTLG